MKKPLITEQRRHNGLTSFGSDVRKIIGPLLGKTGFIQADLLAHWQDILGTALSQGIFPSSIKFTAGKRDEATLTVKAISGAFAMEFTARSTEIIDRMNAYFGYRAIGEIRVIQGAVIPFKPKLKRPTPSPIKKKQAEKLTASIENEKLKEALIELGSYIDDKK